MGRFRIQIEMPLLADSSNEDVEKKLEELRQQAKRVGTKAGEITSREEVRSGKKFVIYTIDAGEMD